MKLRTVISVLLLTVFAAACKEDAPVPSSDSPRLGITISLPAPSITKAEVGEAPASEAENTVHELKLWVFHSTSHALVASLELDSSNMADDFPQAGSVKRYSLPVSWDFALERPRPSVDVFVLANGSSIGSTLTLNSSWDDVNGAVFGGEFFGPASPADAIPGTGLPMSGVAKGLTISGEEPALSVATVSLERCVSKIRFVFCQMKTESPDPNELEIFKVTSIVLDGGKIPSQEYVFAEEAPRVVPGSFVADEMERSGSDSIAESETPELYAYAGQDGPTYERILADALAATPPQITDCGTVYLRESGELLTGTINYTVTKGGVVTAKSAPFSMKAPGDFARNHTWTVYGYYVSKRSLQLSVSVLPWDKSDYTIEFSTASLMVTWKLSVLQQSVAGIDPIPGQKDHYTVTLKRNQAASAYLYVATPRGGKLQVVPVGVDGSENAFDVSFGDDASRRIQEATIDPTNKNGRIDISIDRNPDYAGTWTGKSITLTFFAFTPDGEREIDGASDCIDQIYHFVLP